MYTKYRHLISTSNYQTLRTRVKCDERGLSFAGSPAWNTFPNHMFNRGRTPPHSRVILKLFPFEKRFYRLIVVLFIQNQRQNDIARETQKYTYIHHKETYKKYKK